MARYRFVKKYDPPEERMFQRVTDAFLAEAIASWEQNPPRNPVQEDIQRNLLLERDFRANRNTCNRESV